MPPQSLCEIFKKKHTRENQFQPDSDCRFMHPVNRTNKIWNNILWWPYQHGKHTLSDKTATYILCCVAPFKLPFRALWSTAVLYSIVPPTSLFLKAAEALLKSSRSRSLLGPDRWPNWDPQTKTGLKLLLIWTGTWLPRSANTITPSLLSFVRPLAIHEFAISSALVWWQLTSCKSRRGQWPPLRERLLTWPLMRRPHMYQARPRRCCRARLQRRRSTSVWKDNNATGCTNVENPCKHGARMEVKTTSAVIHHCYCTCIVLWNQITFRQFSQNCCLIMKMSPRFELSSNPMVCTEPTRRITG